MSIIDDALKKTQAKLEKRKGKEDLKSYDVPDEHQSEKEDIVSDQVSTGRAKEKAAWYKNSYALVCIFFSVGGLIYTVLYFTGKPSLPVEPESLNRQSSVVTPDLSGQPILPVQKNIVRPKARQPEPVHEEVGTANEEYAKGLNFYEQGKYKVAVDWYRKAAEHGHVQAQNTLGLRYEKGEGVKQNYKTAAYWYQEAAKNGHTQAQNNLGFMYSEGIGVERDYTGAVKWYRMAAENGHVKAQYNLGVIYYKGQGIEQDYNEAIKWYRKAAEQGYTQSQTILGLMYSKGLGVNQSYKEAVRWYHEAAKRGYSKAQFNLGVMYSKGQGVEHDYKEAAKWYHRAAEEEHAQAQAMLGSMYSKGQGVEQDYKEAVKWYRKAADNGVDYAKEALRNLE